MKNKGLFIGLVLIAVISASSCFKVENPTTCTGYLNNATFAYNEYKEDKSYTNCVELEEAIRDYIDNCSEADADKLNYWTDVLSTLTCSALD